MEILRTMGTYLDITGIELKNQDYAYPALGINKEDKIRLSTIDTQCLVCNSECGLVN